MKILLINTNPVVSRLLTLCTRNRDLILDEVTSVNEVKEVVYDLLFVDDGSYVKEVDLYLGEVSIRKKVFISFVKEVVKGFNLTIQKPFLPSQIIKVIESVDMDEVRDENLKKHTIFPLASEEEKVETKVVKEHGFSLFTLDDRDEISDEVLELLEETMMEEEEREADAPLPSEILDHGEIAKIKALLDMDEEEDIEADMNENEVQVRKVEVIKEQFISEGLEILDEEEIVEVLNNKKEEKKALKHKKTKLKKKKALKQKQLILLESSVTKAITALEPEKIKKFLKGKEIKLKLKIEDHG
ncbi:MAG: hypothetical protein U9O64_08155 [Campylobacterota bacterium]|nr:hypothetical protein [Campylobacterota bacterium]